MGTIIPVGLLLLVCVVFTNAACKYDIKNFKLSTCDGKPAKGVIMSGNNLKFTDSCQLLVIGCFEVTEDTSKLSLDYSAKKGGLSILKEKKNACGYKLFDTVIKCPLNKGLKICNNDKWVVDIPKSLLPMAVGTITGDVKAETSNGKMCFKMSSEIVKKK